MRYAQLLIRGIRRQKITEQGDEEEEQEHIQAENGKSVLFKAYPNELPLGKGDVLLFPLSEVCRLLISRFRYSQCLTAYWYLILGSRTASRTSEINAPITTNML
jgi:hypothetical protein